MHPTTDSTSGSTREFCCFGILHLSLLLALAGWLGLSAGWPDPLRLLPWLAAVVLMLALAERGRPLRSDWRPLARELKRDTQVFGLNLLSDLTVKAVTTLLLASVAGDALDAPLALQLAIGLPLAEFGPYWLHRRSHRGGWMWKSHLLHHRPHKLNVANALTSHPLNAGWDSLARSVPLLGLGFSGEAVLVLGSFALTQSLLAHANVSTRPSVLDWLIGTPDLHRIHHSTDPAQAGNFGTVIPLWDQVFGTWRRGRPPAQVGVYAPELYPTELQLGKLLALPFRRAPRHDSAPARADR